LARGVIWLHPKSKTLGETPPRSRRSITERELLRLHPQSGRVRVFEKSCRVFRAPCDSLPRWVRHEPAITDLRPGGLYTRQEADRRSVHAAAGDERRTMLVNFAVASETYMLEPRLFVFRKDLLGNQNAPSSQNRLGRLKGTMSQMRRIASRTDTLRSRSRCSSSLRNFGLCSSNRSIRSSSCSSGTNWNDGTPLTVTITGSSGHRCAYRLKFAFASLTHLEAQPPIGCHVAAPGTPSAKGASPCSTNYSAVA